MAGDGKGAEGGGDAVEAALGCALPALTAGMPSEEAAKGRQVLSALFSLWYPRLGPDGLGAEAEARRTKAEGLSLEWRRKLLQEDELALGVEHLGGQIHAAALGVLRGEVEVTPDLRKETRRNLARLGKLNAVLVGKYPHLTRLHQEVSDSYLDGMFILGGGKGPLSTRLARAKEEMKGTGAGAGA